MVIVVMRNGERANERVVVVIERHTACCSASECTSESDRQLGETAAAAVAAVFGRRSMVHEAKLWGAWRPDTHVLLVTLIGIVIAASAHHSSGSAGGRGAQEPNGMATTNERRKERQQRGGGGGGGRPGAISSNSASSEQCHY